MKYRLNVYAVVLAERGPQGHATGRELLCNNSHGYPPKPAIFGEKDEAEKFMADMARMFPADQYRTLESPVDIELPEGVTIHERFPGGQGGTESGGPGGG